MADYEGRYLHQQLGNYRLVKLLGYGGFAEVYLGEHIHMGTQTAVKVLTAKLTPEEIEHFRNEARTIFGLEHPNIVRVLDYGLNDNIPYIVMSYAANGSLRKRHPRGTRVPLPTVVEYVKQIAAALQYAHDHNIIHRDIKPDNILVGSRGELLIGDFGIAVISKTGRSSLQSSYNIGGTPYYMAPEAFRGKPEKASDQYALGIMVYEWLCGQLPFTEGDSIQIGYQHNYESIPSLCEQASGILSSVEQVVMKALAKNPKERYARVQEFADKLEEAHKKPPIGTTLLKYKGHGDGWRDAAWSPDGKYLVTGNIVGEVQIWDAATGNLIRTCGEHESMVNAVAWSPDGRRLASVSTDKTVQIWDAIFGKPILSLTDHTDEINDVAWSPDGNKLVSASSDKGVRIWNVTSGQCLFNYTGHSDAVNAVVWSPDGTRIASGSADGIVRVWYANTGQRISSCTHPATVLAISWSPYEDKIVSSSPCIPDSVWIGIDDITDVPCVVRIWDANTGAYLSQYSECSYGANSVVWSPDGQKIVLGTTTGVICVWDTSNDRVNFLDSITGSRFIGEPYGGIISATWSPDGSRLAYCSEEGTMRVWNISTNQRIFSYEGHSGDIRSIAWSPDGNKLASASDDSTVHVWDANQGKHLLTYTGHSKQVSAVAWSPSGKELASSSADLTVKIWNGNTGQIITSHKTFAYCTLSVAWSPVGPPYQMIWADRFDHMNAVSWANDGSKLAFGSNDRTMNVQIKDIATNKQLFAYTHSHQVFTVAWSPNDQKLASGGEDGTVQIWNSTVGKHLQTYKAHSDYVSNVTWSPDGRRIASCSRDKTVRIWDAYTGELLYAYLGHGGPVWSIAWSPDGTRIASSSYGVVRVWQAV